MHHILEQEEGENIAHWIVNTGLYLTSNLLSDLRTFFILFMILYVRVGCLLPSSVFCVESTFSPVKRKFFKLLDVGVSFEMLVYYRQLTVL